MASLKSRADFQKALGAKQPPLEYQSDALENVGRCSQCGIRIWIYRFRTYFWVTVDRDLHLHYLGADACRRTRAQFQS